MNPVPASGRRIIVVCEGQTEETFVNNVLSPNFHTQRLVLVPRLIPTSPGQRGGALNYDRVQRFLRNTLRESGSPIVTTLFDLYALNNKFPGFADAAGKSLDTRLKHLTSAFHEDIVALSECRPDHFLPYFQPYEFEALLFSDVPTLTTTEPGWEAAAAKLQAVRDKADSPEHINDGPTTKPAAQLAAHLTTPPYNKVLYGHKAAERITVATMENECGYFAAWLTALRRFAP